MSATYDVAAYVWPSYTGDEPRSRMFWPAGFGEWETVMKAMGKHPEHSWPRRPLWGYVNEADPRVMEMQIDAAADHGVNVFIYDWYWYDRRPFLEQCLNTGYLGARNNNRVRFYLMWANHDVNHLWDIRLSSVPVENTIWKAGVDRPEFERLTAHMIDTYFRHPAYYTINGRPVLMVYDLQVLINGLGGIGPTAEALAGFRERAIRSVFPGVHLQACLRKIDSSFTGADAAEPATQAAVIARLGFDSASHYQFVHFVDIDRDYDAILADVTDEWKRLESELSVP